jgi:hypothetical protein
MSYLKNTLAVLLLVPCLAGAGLAEERHHRDGRAEWHGEIGRFHEHDMELWRGGRWHHGRHEGRNGWWWIVGGVWYFYPVRVMPYPDPYQPPMVVVPPVPAAPQYWYYCANPAGYYPYVAQCVVGWQRVPATVPPAAPPR